MEAESPSGVGRSCRKCGERIEPLFVVADCGLFVQCACGPRPAPQVLSSIYFVAAAFGLAVTITLYSQISG